MVRSLLFLSSLIMLWSCADKASPGVEPLRSPARPGSGEGNLTVGADGSLYLSWIEPEAGNHVFKFSRWEGEEWSPSREIARGGDWFVNWADVPALAVLGDGRTFFAHWLGKSGEGTYAYDVQVSRSLDGGETWSAHMTPHRDSTETEHGFVSWAPLSADRAGLVWLDGRETGGDGHGHGDEHGHGGAMTLRFATLGTDGALGDEAVIDSRVCDCCPTDLATSKDGSAVVAYRDRSDDEIRDIRIARYDGTSWSEGALVHPDGWKINGCPVNGPAIAVEGSLLAVAWFTVDSSDNGHVRIAFSPDGGGTFGAPIEMAGPDPLGRVGLALQPDGTAWVVWLESVKDGWSEVRLSSVRTGGKPSPPIVVGTTSASRASGVPRVSALGKSIFVAWTSAEIAEGATPPTRVLTARVR